MTDSVNLVNTRCSGVLGLISNATTIVFLNGHLVILPCKCLNFLPIG